MESFLALLDRYPGAWTVLGPILAGLAWAIVSGLFNAFYDSRSPHSDEEWAAFFVRHPRWGAVVAVFKTAGFNLPGFLRSLRVLFGGPLPDPVKLAMSGTRPPTARALRDAAVAAGRELVREENAQYAEKESTKP